MDNPLVAGKLMVAAVLLLAAVAAADALRPEVGARDTRPRSPTVTAGAGEESPAEAVAALRAARVRGTIVFTDEDRCALRAVRLPALAPAARPRTGPDPGCAFSLSPDGTRAASPGVAWTSDSRRLAFCRGRTAGISVGFEGAFVRQWRGCAPAWRPDGTLTLVRDGTVSLAEDGGVARGDGVLIDAAAVARPVTHRLDGDVVRLRGYAIVDVAWLSPTRAVLLLDVVVRILSGGVRDANLPIVAFFEGGRDVAVHTYLGPGQLTRLAASRRGRYVSVWPRLLLRSDGSEVSLPDWLRDVRAIELSPDERWVAVASRGGVYLFRTWELDLFDRASRSPRSIRLPFVARDIAWR